MVRPLNNKTGTIELTTIAAIDLAKSIEPCQCILVGLSMALRHGEAGVWPSLQPCAHGPPIGWIGHAAFVANPKASTHARVCCVIKNARKRRCRLTIQGCWPGGSRSVLKTKQCHCVARRYGVVQLGKAISVLVACEWFVAFLLKGVVCSNAASRDSIAVPSKSLLSLVVSQIVILL